jgi:cytochrome b
MKTYIWSLPTRIFHWLLVIGMVAAYILSDEEELLNFHSSVGYMVGILIIFRIIWGFAGPKYSRFSDFPIGMNSLKNFATDMKGSKSHSPGHNPAASIVMMGIILFSLMIVVTGILLLASEGQGLFAFIKIGLSEDILKETHEISVNIVIGLVIAHLLGNLVDFISNKKAATLLSMFTGYKNIDAEGIKLTSFQKFIAAIGILAALAIVPYSIVTQKLTPEAEKSGQENPKISKEEEEED